MLSLARQQPNQTQSGTILSQAHTPSSEYGLSATNENAKELVSSSPAGRAPPNVEAASVWAERFPAGGQNIISRRVLLAFSILRRVVAKVL